MSACLHERQVKDIWVVVAVRECTCECKSQRDADAENQGSTPNHFHPYRPNRCNCTSTLQLHCYAATLHAVFLAAVAVPPAPVGPSEAGSSSKVTVFNDNSHKRANANTKLYR